MKASGIGTCVMAKDLSVIPMATLILASLKMVKLMEKAYTHGKMVKYMTASGIRDLNKVMVYGRELIRILILENGVHQKLMVMVCILGQMEIDMKGNGLCV